MKPFVFISVLINKDYLMKTQKETPAQKALRLLSPIPPSKWIKGDFSDDNDKCCAIGHYTRLTSKNPNDYSTYNCSDRSNNSDLRYISKVFLEEKHGAEGDIASVNNYPTVNGYTQKSIKARVIKCLQDMIKAGY